MGSEVCPAPTGKQVFVWAGHRPAPGVWPIQVRKDKEGSLEKDRIPHSTPPTPPVYSPALVQIFPGADLSTNTCLLSSLLCGTIPLDGFLLVFVRNLSLLRANPSV